MTENNRWWESYLVRYLPGNIFAVLVLFYLVAFNGDDIQESLCSNPDKLSVICSSPSNPKHICTTNSESKSICATKTEPKESCPDNDELKLCKPSNFSGEVFGFIFITTKVIESSNDKTAFKDSDFLSHIGYESHRIIVTEINFANILLLGVFGFLYMYISSMPIYLFHIIRGAFSIKKENGKCYAINFFCHFIENIYTYLRESTLQRQQISNKSDNILKFYNSNNYIKFSSEYITSSKHIREHGNAFGIIFLEIIFAKLLIKCEFSILLIVIWLLLGFSGWFLGTYLESKIIPIPDTK